MMNQMSKEDYEPSEVLTLIMCHKEGEHQVEELLCSLDISGELLNQVMVIEGVETLAELEYKMVSQGGLFKG